MQVIHRIDAVVNENIYTVYDLHKYYTGNIKFKPEFNKLEVISLFLEKIKGINEVATESR